MFCGETIIPEGLSGSQLSFKFTIRSVRTGGIIMFRLALCGKNCELLEKIKSHIQIFVETYKNETKCISIEQYKQLASLRDDMVDGIHFDILMVEIFVYFRKCEKPLRTLSSFSFQSFSTTILLGWGIR